MRQIVDHSVQTCANLFIRLNGQIRRHPVHRPHQWKRVRRFLLPVLSAATCLIISGRVLGFINPTFTPVDLVRDADSIVFGTIEAGTSTDEFKLSKTKSLKGENSATTITLKDCNKDDVDEIRKLFAN